MIATDEQISLIRSLLKIDDTSDETLKIIRLYVGAAEMWLNNTGVKPDYNNDLYINAVAVYAGHQYDNLEGDSSSTTLSAMAEQLRLAQSVAEEARENDD